MFDDVSKQNFNNDKDKEFNRNVLNKNNISIGAEARILESKGILEKGSQKYSLNLYKLIEREGIYAMCCMYYVFFKTLFKISRKIMLFFVLIYEYIYLVICIIIFINLFFIGIFIGFIFGYIFRYL